ncbi:TonB-dependent receptor plug domain-containing protein [Pontimicrobium aquaticum]|uniref:TonB-dependent receptor n=1 Tax=Pontimicrobium aquaticum TaxID=2565367 RepID=A0A4U0F1I6_9FLAO|nr:TonB-dependent receptor [Pontimicrobium aquaticum]TJY38130.1 TonB-dependent receptor [Pontimicrobium aquaticum]
MKRKLTLTIAVFITIFQLNAQEVSRQSLDSITLIGNRIDIPFKKNSRTVTVITASQISQSPATNVTELLQQVAGIDMRRRGVNGMQADLYIRGGSFDQTLVLIDGIKVEDAQTGHHTMNMALPIEVIERIEIIKGPAARIFGQNAFTGAINIVTKKNTNNVNTAGFQVGSFGQQHATGTTGIDFNRTSIIAHASVNTSDGYRHNTDFKNHNYFIKGTFNKNHTPINLIGYYTDRKFGANGFYASPSAINQYEETQSSLVGASSVYKKGNFTLKPRLYWKRNQDMYVFVRNNPSIYRNLHISNKVGGEVNISYKSNLGTTGFGVDIAKVYLSSNNLGNRDRFMTNMFLEHRFTFADDKLDVTPGIAINYFSDFKFHAFPGIDIGYQVNDHLKIYANAGYTYRIPTYTDLFYNDPTTVGNEDLEPEEALTEELGIKYTKGSFSGSLAIFNRDSNNLIDYVKEKSDDLWEATNIQNLNTIGLEANASINYTISGFNQNITLGYTYLDEDLKKSKVNFSRYSINSLQHHATATFRTQFFKNFRQSIAYKFAKRTEGTDNDYHVVDLKATLYLKSFEISVIGNNIFNTYYTETNLVPMPKGNVLLDVKYRF